MKIATLVAVALTALASISTVQAASAGSTASTSRFELDDARLDVVKAGAQTSPGAPFVQGGVKAPKVVTNVKNPAKVCCQTGATFKPGKNK